MRRSGEGRRCGRLAQAAARWALGAAFAFALVLAAPAAALAEDAAFAGGDADAAARTVRVAFPQQPQVMWTNEEGARSGYTYEYLERIAQYTGWDYEFVPVEGDCIAAFETSRALLEAGEVDLVAGVMPAAADGGPFLLTRGSYATFEAVLQVDAARSDDPLLSADEGRPLRVAAAGQAALLDDLETFCSRNGIPYEVVSCACFEDAQAAVLEGRADVALATDMGPAEGLRAVAHVASHPLYFAVARGSEALAAEIDAALSQIDNVDPTFRQRLREIYFARAGTTFVLDDEDRAYIASAGPIKVGVLANQPPYQYEEDGEVKGIAIDLLKTVSQKTRLSFEFVTAASEEELDELQAQGAIDMVACVDYNYATARERLLALTQPYVTATYVLVANAGAANGDIAGKRLALAATSRYDGVFVGNVQRFPSVAECLQAVLDGEADYTYVDEYVMQYFLNLPDYRGLRVAPQTHEPRRLSFGIARGGDAALLGIVDRAVGSLSEIELQGVINGNVMSDQPFDIVDFVRAHPVETFAAGAAVLLVVLLLVLVILYQRARENAKTAFDLKKRLRFYALCDDYFFEYDKRTDTLVVSLPDDGRRGDAEPVVISMNASSFVIEKADKEAFLELLRSDERRTEELRLPDADGIEHWLRISVEPVDDAGRSAGTVGKMKIIDDERQEKDQLLAKAERDSLTGLLNSDTTRRRVEQQLAALAPDGHGALVMVDIDRFKEVNDTYGHLVGDHVLVGVARVLRESFRVGDVVGRLGGDEFMVYMDRVDASLAEAKCESVRHSVERHAFDGTDCQVTISTGCALSERGESFEDLYRRADEALYEAKRSGRNRCGF
ncbi:transporter substrate-binding domain-containing diguanylate cyclase [Arabiibacter massiliensis]|uniref:transporter substrate-binding domain-containing diguanylate cyclase n=1 Tax=Arabiibacter massiliensis TaxID=1870985 RepID=UPI0009BB8BB3|nr:diguanylate cyclase [Arabiibacter massiliensis]